ncbi:hypothetical protein SAMN02745248_02516 [Hathewaya proteolytica DSM 3090]|uniref:Uncharacterized protein n=1 Tax=Hathewaya proteolytica DSM 3090 TaxID=1121331 RepID=A0A1M6SCM6_9CLOT|nr:hypothetical protein [Hathewaya proteolytica]SHK42524.1 hypothetical protein SAMN02745248_02516 [Hathewaya proteolytica DSM 3090]
MNKGILDTKERERLNKQKQLNEFNSVTQSVKPVNQNQTHNVKMEGLGPSLNRNK